ncbi:NADH-quinone oxidoreductase subunit A [Cesiribacter andamanensis]|nr:NADH-quinone oxidoreductase subunit A [Cesiribacter andamanensis]
MLLYLIGGLVFVLGALATAWLIRPARPNVEKLSTYESGEEPSGSAWGQFNVRFYIIALVFILFDVELVFLFPWATVFGRRELIAESGGLWGWFALAEMALFVGILALGLAWAWARGLLEWVRPAPEVRQIESPVPEKLYQKVNAQVASFSSTSPKEKRSVV